MIALSFSAVFTFVALGLAIWIAHRDGGDELALVLALGACILMIVTMVLAYQLDHGV